MIIICPICLTKNKTTEERMISMAQGEGRIVCGSCSAKLLGGEVYSLSDQNFDKIIFQQETPIVVDFWADWCQPCKIMGPQFELAASQLPEVLFTKLDTEKGTRSASRMRIQGIPTLIVFKNGMERARRSGVMDTPSIVKWVSAASKN